MSLELTRSRMQRGCLQRHGSPQDEAKVQKERRHFIPLAHGIGSVIVAIYDGTKKERYENLQNSNNRQQKN